MADTADLGPLPKSDRNDELEELSLKALNSAVPVERFRVRAEPGKDRGVDQFLEAKSNGYDTNCRAQIQMKSIEHFEPNADGSVSKSIEVNNLNYLLNGPCPLYILWIAETNDLRFAWARDVIRQIESENANWRSATTITIRFQMKIDVQNLGEIHNRIIAEAKLARSMYQTLAHATQHEHVPFSRPRQRLLGGDCPPGWPTLDCPQHQPIHRTPREQLVP